MLQNLFLHLLNTSGCRQIGQLIVVVGIALSALLCSATRCEAQVLISNLVQTDIGNTGTTGSNTQSAGAYTVTGAGSGVGGASSDSFSYLSVAASGDLEMIAKVLSQTSTNPYAFTGLMLRSSLSADSVQASIGVTPSNVSVRRTASFRDLNFAACCKA